MKALLYPGEVDVVANVGPGERKATLTGLRPSTKYDIFVQPFNQVGFGRPSPPAHVTTQDGRKGVFIIHRTSRDFQLVFSEMKVEFSERFYTFKSSDKKAVIPIKRSFTRGYATLNWNAKWSMKDVEVTDSSSSSSDSEDDRVIFYFSMRIFLTF